MAGPAIGCHFATVLRVTCALSSQYERQAVQRGVEELLEQVDSEWKDIQAGLSKVKAVGHIHYYCTYNQTEYLRRICSVALVVSMCVFLTAVKFKGGSRQG